MKDLVIVSVWLTISVYPTFILIGIKNRFLKWWNSLLLKIRTSSSLGIFKHNLLKYLYFLSHNYLFCIGDRLVSISDTHLRLNFSALKYHLFFRKIVVLHHPVLFVMHLLKMRNIISCTAQVLPLREKLFASAAQLFGNRWHRASVKKKIDWFLIGISRADFEANVRFFQYVQLFVSLSNRFC